MPHHPEPAEGPTAAAQAAGPARPDSMMWLNVDRVVYVGLVGEPMVRELGAYSIYVSLSKTHRISIEGGPWQESELSVVPPYVSHSLVSGDRMICDILIEADSVAVDKLPAYIANGRGAVPAPETASALRGALERFQSGTAQQTLQTADFDQCFFGQALEPRVIDRRIRAVLAKIKDDPNSHTSAQDCAEASHLSVSRFLHLFKTEAGTPFRSFRTWQRARSVLYYVTQDANLAQIALDVGYPDSTHFSHSVRQVYGLTPKSIFAVGRKIDVHGRVA